MTVSHGDGFPVMPVSTDALLIGMGERLDVTAKIADGTLPLVAEAEGKIGRALAIIRTSSGGPLLPTSPCRNWGGRPCSAPISRERRRHASSDVRWTAVTTWHSAGR